MKDRSIIWVFVAFTLGFALPVCSCTGMGVVALGSLGRLASTSGPTTAGVGDAVGLIHLNGTITSGSQDYFS